MPASCSSTNRRGTGTPEAMATSSTTLRRRRNAGSRVSSGTHVPPSCAATAAPPPRSEAMRYSEPSPITTPVSRLAATTASTLPLASHTTTSTAPTMAATASVNSSTSRVELRRAASWCSKKFKAAPAGSELHLRRLAHLRPVGGDLQQRRRAEAEGVGQQHRGEGLTLVVVGHDRVVVGLPR